MAAKVRPCGVVDAQVVSTSNVAHARSHGAARGKQRNGYNRSAWDNRCMRATSQNKCGALQPMRFTCDFDYCAAHENCTAKAGAYVDDPKSKLLGHGATVPGPPIVIAVTAVKNHGRGKVLAQRMPPVESCARSHASAGARRPRNGVWLARYGNSAGRLAGLCFDQKTRKVAQMRLRGLHVPMHPWHGGCFSRNS